MLEKKKPGKIESLNSLEKKEFSESFQNFLSKNRLLKNLPDLHEDIKNCILNFLHNPYFLEKSNLITSLKILHEKAIENTKELVSELLPNQIHKSNFKILDNYDFSKSDFYKVSSNPQKEAIKGFYLLSVYYLIKYTKRLSEVDKLIIEKFKTEPKQLITSSQIANSLYHNKIKDIEGLLNGTSLEEKEKIQIIELLIIITDNFSIKVKGKKGTEILNFLNEIIEKARIKQLDSIIKKLLKDQKYRKQITTELVVLSDQIGFKKEFPTVDEAKGRALAIKQSLPKHIIIKENDRGIIEENHSNKDTNINKPFINFSFVDKKNVKIPLGEFSIRLTDDLSDILNKLTPRKDYYFDKNQIKITNWESFTKLAIDLIEEINHPIYKTSQDIRIIRKLLVDWALLGKNKFGKPKTKPNFERNFLEQKFQEFFLKFISILNEFHIATNLSRNDLKTIQLAYYIKLLKLVEKAIIDIAWEPFKKDIENLNIYNAIPRKSTTRKIFKKDFSILFSKWLLENKKNISFHKMKRKLKKISRKLNIESIPLKKFDEDVKKLLEIYNNFFNYYYGSPKEKGILNTAIFKPVIEEIIKEILEGKTSHQDKILITQLEAANILSSTNPGK